MFRTFAVCHSNNVFLCPICHSPEIALQNGETKRVLLTSSTLYGVWDQVSISSLTDHFEMECIVGKYTVVLCISFYNFISLAKLHGFSKNYKNVDRFYETS